MNSQLLSCALGMKFQRLACSCDAFRCCAAAGPLTSISVTSCSSGIAPPNKKMNVLFLAKRPGIILLRIEPICGDKFPNVSSKNLPRNATLAILLFGASAACKCASGVKKSVARHSRLLGLLHCGCCVHAQVSLATFVLPVKECTRHDCCQALSHCFKKPLRASLLHLNSLKKKLSCNARCNVPSVILAKKYFR